VSPTTYGNTPESPYAQGPDFRLPDMPAQYPPPAPPTFTPQPPGRPSPMWYGIAAGAVVLALVAGFISGRFTAPQTPAPSPGTVATTQPTQRTTSQPTKPTGPVTHATTPSPVTLNETFTDEPVGMKITILKAATAWVPALPTGDTSMDDSKLMIGIQVSVDFTNAIDNNWIDVHNGKFTIVTPAGGYFGCQVPTSTSPEQAAAIAQAISGDKSAMLYQPRLFDGAGLAGWIPCFAEPLHESAATDAPYKLLYERSASPDGQGNVYLSFSRATDVHK